MQPTAVQKAQDLGTMTGYQFKANREQLDLDQQFLANLMGISRAAVSRAEAHRNKPIKACHALAMVALMSTMED